MKAPALPRATMLRIGQQLRAHLDPVTLEPLPPVIADLLAQIEAKLG